MKKHHVASAVAYVLAQFAADRLKKFAQVGLLLLLSSSTSILAQDYTCQDPNIQSCLDTHPGEHIVLPTGTLKPGQPLVMNGQGQWLSGSNDGEWNARTVIAQQIQAPPGAQGGRISDLEIADCAGDGIQVGAGEFTVDHVSVESCTGNGIAIYGDSSVWPNSQPDKWHLEDVKLSGNAQNGLFVTGCDGNNGIATNLQVMGNGEWGIYDNSCFGNVYQSPNLIANHFGSIWTRGGSNNSIFQGPYIESGQANSLKAPAIVLGSNSVDSSTQPNGQAIYMNANGASGLDLRTFQLAVINPRDQEVVLQLQSGATASQRRMIQFVDQNGNPTFSMFQDSGCLSFVVGSAELSECPDGTFKFYGTGISFNGQPIPLISKVEPPPTAPGPKTNASSLTDVERSSVVRSSKVIASSFRQKSAN